MTQQVADAYQDYIAAKRELEPEAEPVAMLELTALELHILTMTLAEKGAIVYPKHLCTKDEALDLWDSLKRKIVATRVQQLPGAEPVLGSQEG